jgi:hypothetical protein
MSVLGVVHGLRKRPAIGRRDGNLSAAKLPRDAPSFFPGRLPIGPVDESPAEVKDDRIESQQLPPI